MPKAAPSHILIIDDDARLRQLIGRFLKDEGYRVTQARDTVEARRRLEGIVFDCLVVDIMLPGESGLDFVRDLKARTPDVACLLLTAMGEPGHRLHGLESGADDYMTKPFEPLELSLRLKNILGRGGLNAYREASDGGASDAGEGVDLGGGGGFGGGGGVRLRFGPHVFDLGRQHLSTGGRRQHLTTSERVLLGCFCSHPRAVLSREVLSAMLGGQMEGRSIDVAVARLRRKIELTPSKPVYLLTVRGRGWCLETDG